MRKIRVDMKPLSILFQNTIHFCKDDLIYCKFACFDGQCLFNREEQFRYDYNCAFSEEELGAEVKSLRAKLFVGIKDGMETSKTSRRRSKSGLPLNVCNALVTRVRGT